MARPPPSLRDFLRAGTAELHERLDAATLARGYFSSLDRYADFLDRSHRFVAGAERALDSPATTALLSDWPARRRTALLVADLASLGRSPSALHDLLPVFSGTLTDAQRWGVLYVLEGSTLGGLVLLDRLAPLGVSAARGGAYLAAGEHPARRWHTFVQALARQDMATFDRAAALDAARFTFSAASDCLG